MVAGGVRLASNKNHWEDVAVGFTLGGAIAFYLVCLFDLKSIIFVLKIKYR